jgi:cytochrome c oxidase subunit 2
MKVDLYEKIWIWGAIVLIVVFAGSIAATAVGSAVHPPSHVETIDPKTVRAHPEFGSPGVVERPDGSVVVTSVAQIWSFLPQEIRVPAGRPVTFRVTSPDILHGFQIPRTNVNMMVAPGYVSQMTTTFDRPGEYLIVCNEYCGLGHHLMAAKLIVEGGAR